VASRQGDIIIVVCQNNDEYKLTIEKADDSIENIIGYEAKELMEKDLREILLPSVNEILDSFLDFEEDGNDLAIVLGKVRDFGFVTKLGYEVKLNMRMNRALPGEEYPRFEIIIKDQSEVSEGSKSALRNFRGRQVIDKATGLPDKESFMKEAEFINFCVMKDRIVASFALVSIDGVENFKDQYGEKVTESIINELVNRCRINFREDDILGSVGDNMIGIILLEARTAVAKIPLNRLRWQIASQPFIIGDSEEITITLSVTFSEITKERLVEDAFELCKERIENLRGGGGNKIAEIT
jgi:diguanylate cyclase (GGDEF)-like protein